MMHAIGRNVQLLYRTCVFLSVDSYALPLLAVVTGASEGIGRGYALEVSILYSSLNNINTSYNLVDPFSICFVSFLTTLDY